MTEEALCIVLVPKLLSLRLENQAMNIKETLLERSGGSCELCSDQGNLEVYAVPPYVDGADRSIVICKYCQEQIAGVKPLDSNHWRCLNNSIWSPLPAVQVIAWRILNGTKSEGWPQDLLDTLYLDDETLAWAKVEPTTEADDTIIHKDSHGAILKTGDTVVLIKDLDVKGASFTAKRGTAVRSITLVHDNPDQISGRVNGQQIVLLTKFVKKSM